MSEDTWLSQLGEKIAVGIWYLEARGVAKYAVMHKTSSTTKNYLGKSLQD